MNTATDLGMTYKIHEEPYGGWTVEISIMDRLVATNYNKNDQTIA